MFDQVVFAGGGGRCTWQIGFWESIADEIGLSPRRVTAVSAGGLMASLILMGRIEAGREHFWSAFAANRKNAYWSNLLKKERVFPQYGIFRNAMLELFRDGLEPLSNAADLQIAITHPPRFLTAGVAFGVGALAYYTDKHVMRRLHPKVALGLGFKQNFYRAQDCATVEELVELILCSSCTPPFTPRLRRFGAPVLDGGVVDNIPVAGLDSGEGRVLILLSRRYPRYPNCFTRRNGEQLWTYVQPSKPPFISVWDYTNPELAQMTYELGCADGREFLHKPMFEQEISDEQFQ
ncbi:patatin-like phospholipase family protein [Microbulbifer echini]|uniref:Patatin-like phospholipase family protein n=1 Tax=Microbulbifer echini TaxID=1529067 RepID=A0ABV4NTA6_9GAMM|nr:patatin-like phospholipase family protein [uncultured Microbulbifer sp.]